MYMYVCLSIHVKARLAYDRPSEKFLGFLSKHYGLSKYLVRQCKVHSAMGNRVIKQYRTQTASY